MQYDFTISAPCSKASRAAEAIAPGALGSGMRSLGQGSASTISGRFTRMHSEATLATIR